MRTLHELPRFDERWSYLYLERGCLDQTAAGLAFRDQAGTSAVPIDQLSLLMLGPGSTVTHAAVKSLAANNCLVAWVGDGGVRLYAHSTGGTLSARRLLHQARLATRDDERLRVAVRMYQKRFPGCDLAGKSLEQIRGMEGVRVRNAYVEAGRECGIDWSGRNYDQEHWHGADPANRALSAANACLYGVCHAAIVSAGYSAGLGFIHTGRMLSFVYDIADLYKVELIVPLAFRLAKAEGTDLDRRVRLACRRAFFESRLVERILPDITEVLGAGDDCRESPAELEGRAVALADRAGAGRVPGESESARAG